MSNSEKKIAKRRLISKFQHVLISYIINRSPRIFKHIYLSHTCIDSTTTIAPDLITINEISHETNVTDSPLFSRATVLVLHSSRSNGRTGRRRVYRSIAVFYLVELRFRRIRVTYIRPTPLPESILIDEQFSSPAILTETCRYATRRYHPSSFYFLPRALRKGPT